MIDLDQSTKIDNIEAEEDDEILSIPAEDLTDLNEPDQREKLMCDFIIKQVIGEGTFATVRLAVNKQTGEKVAIKIMEKNKIVQKVDKIRIEREIKVLKNLMHQIRQAIKEDRLLDFKNEFFKKFGYTK